MVSVVSKKRLRGLTTTRTNAGCSMATLSPSCTNDKHFVKARQQSMSPKVDKGDAVRRELGESAMRNKDS